MEGIIIRNGKPEDLPRVHELVFELATYEKAPREVTNTVEMMEKDGFGNQPLFGLLVAESENTIIGISLYYFRYSTWKGKMFYLEDLIVTQAYRGKGIGKLLFDASIMEAKKTHCQGMVWEVLEWNEPAFNFYRKYDPVIDPEWVVCKLSKNQIDEFQPS